MWAAGSGGLAGRVGLEGWEPWALAAPWFAEKQPHHLLGKKALGTRVLFCVNVYEISGLVFPQTNRSLPSFSIAGQFRLEGTPGGHLV